MEEDVLMHYGVKGMKWGVRKDKKSSGRNKKNRTFKIDDASSRIETKRYSSKGKKVHAEIRKLSDEELNRRIKRLQLERSYRDLLSYHGESDQYAAVKLGRKAVNKVLDNSAKSYGEKGLNAGLDFANQAYENLMSKRGRRSNT